MVETHAQQAYNTCIRVQRTACLAGQQSRGPHTATQHSNNTRLELLGFLYYNCSYY